MKSKGPTPSFEARLLLREFSHRIIFTANPAPAMITLAGSYLPGKAFLQPPTEFLRDFNGGRKRQRAR